jgi:hypothetical protein
MQEDGVAIGISAGNLGGGNHAARAADIFNHDRLTQRFLHRVLNNAGGGIIHATRWKSYNHGDRTFGIILRARSTGSKTACRTNNDRQYTGNNHRALPHMSQRFVC